MKELTDQQYSGAVGRNALYSVTARVPQFDLCLSTKDVDDDVVQIDTILEALEPGYPPPEIDERRRSRADVKYYESASTTEGSDDRGQRERKRLKKNEYSRIYRARKMEKLKTLSGNQPLAPTHKRSLVCPHCGLIGKRAGGFANHLRACRRRHGDEPTPTPSPDEAASEEDENNERREQREEQEQQEEQEQREQQEQRRHANAIVILEDTIGILEDTRRLAGDQLTLMLPIIVPSAESPEY